MTHRLASILSACRSACTVMVSRVLERCAAAFSAWATSLASVAFCASTRLESRLTTSVRSARISLPAPAPEIVLAAESSELALCEESAIVGPATVTAPPVETARAATPARIGAEGRRLSRAERVPLEVRTARRLPVAGERISVDEVATRTGPDGAAACEATVGVCSTAARETRAGAVRAERAPQRAGGPRTLGLRTGGALAGTAARRGGGPGGGRRDGGRDGRCGDGGRHGSRGPLRAAHGALTGEEGLARCANLRGRTTTAALGSVVSHKGLPREKWGYRRASVRITRLTVPDSATRA